MPSLKSELLSACKNLLDHKISTIDQAINDITDSLLNETKSSVGDKHETARARMQSEQEKLTSMKHDLLLQRQSLNRVKGEETINEIKDGAVVITDKQSFFFISAIGKIEVNGLSFQVISKTSPIAKQLFGHRVGEEVFLNNVRYLIKEIL